jgi:hypothetical protein
LCLQTKICSHRWIWAKCNFCYTTNIVKKHTNNMVILWNSTVYFILISKTLLWVSQYYQTLIFGDIMLYTAWYPHNKMGLHGGACVYHSTTEFNCNFSSINSNWTFPWVGWLFCNALSRAVVTITINCAAVFMISDRAKMWKWLWHIYKTHPWYFLVGIEETEYMPLGPIPGYNLTSGWMVKPIPWSRVPEKHAVSQLVNKNALHLAESRGSPHSTTCPNPEPD